MISDVLEKVQRTLRWHIVRPVQRFLTGYSYDMAWDPYSHMAKKIYPIFKSYAEIPPHGAPTHIILKRNRKQYVKQFGKERVDAYLQYNGSDDYDEELENKLFEHWSEIINHVRYTLEWVAVHNEEYPGHVYDPNPKYDPNQKEPFHFEPCEDHPGYSEMISHEDYGEHKLNSKRQIAFEEYISEGFELLGLYWRSFWD